jgi:methylamine dehydrogenase accessory protein MauD
MNSWWSVSFIVLWLIVLWIGFLLLGALRSLALMRWRLDQFEATNPRRIGRDGLKPGTRAPDFRLLGVGGMKVTLSEFAGRRVLLVFTQSGCAPCHKVLPELDRLHRDGLAVLVVNNGEPEATRRWAAGAGVRVPILIQEKFELSRRYEVYATPFAFLIDERGVIVSKGLINNRQHIEFVLSGVVGEGASHHAAAGTDAAVAVRS